MIKFVIAIVSIFFMLMITPVFVSAAMPPQFKECLQRGYEISAPISELQDYYCIFPDNNQCLLSEFNEGACGSEYMTENYCIEEGIPVWDTDKCCPGLIAYLPFGMIGQQVCQPFYYTIVFNPVFWLVIIIIVLVYWIIKKKRK
jgi:hypothetical protein